MRVGKESRESRGRKRPEGSSPVFMHLSFPPFPSLSLSPLRFFFFSLFLFFSPIPKSLLLLFSSLLFTPSSLFSLDFLFFLPSILLFYLLSRFSSSFLLVSSVFLSMRLVGRPFLHSQPFLIFDSTLPSHSRTRDRGRRI